MRETAAAETFARISQELSDEPDEPATLHLMVERALEVVQGSDFCSVSLCMPNGTVATVAGTSAIILECDALQYELGEGPCLDAIEVAPVYTVEDTSRDVRWPSWGPQVAAKGIWSMLSVRIFTSARIFGCLNMYSGKTNSFSPEDIEVAVIYAMHAATAVAGAKLVDGLQTAVVNRHQIGLAQGILMNRYGLSPHQAFEVLRRYSSRSHTKIRDVASGIVSTGSLPADQQPHGLPSQKTLPKQSFAE